MKTFAAPASLAVMIIGFTACAGRTNDNVRSTGETIEVNPVQPAEIDSMNHDAEAVTLPDSIEVPE